MNYKVKSYLKDEYDGLVFYVKHNQARCVRAGIESVIMSSLMVSWVFYLMKPVLNDVNNYGVTTNHPDSIVVLGLCGFVFLSFYFLMTSGWYFINKYLFKAFGNHIKPEIHYRHGVEQ